MVSTLIKVVSAQPTICPASLFAHSVSLLLLTAWLPLVPVFPTVCSDKALTLASQGFVVCGKKRLCYRVMRPCACCMGVVMWGYSMMMFSPSSPSCLSVVAGLGLFLSLPCSSNSP